MEKRKICIDQFVQGSDYISWPESVLLNRVREVYTVKILEGLKLKLSRWQLSRLENNGQPRAPSIQDCPEVAVIIAGDEEDSFPYN